MDRVRDLPDDDTWIPARRKAIGDRIRDLRHDLSLTQEQVYLAARISRWTFQRVEAGEEVQLGTLLRIAWVLDVPISDLVQ